MLEQPSLGLSRWRLSCTILQMASAPSKSSSVLVEVNGLRG